MIKQTCEVCDNLDGINNSVVFQHLNNDNCIDYFRCDEHWTDEECEEDHEWSRI
jgi:hypothetical protein